MSQRVFNNGSNTMLPWLESPYQGLQNNIQQNTLHHAILVHGRAGVGKSELCRLLAQRLLCLTPELLPCGKCRSCQLFAAGSHPDLHEIAVPGQIGVDDIRDATRKLIGTAQFGRGKVLLVQQAERMTVAASNSLLKTLEEPTQHTHLLLITSHPNQLLATIMSRCLKLPLQVTHAQQVKQWLTQQQHFQALTPQQQQQTLSRVFPVYWNRPLTLLENIENNEQLHLLENDISQLLQAQLSEQVFVEKYLDKIDVCIEWLLFYVRQALVQAADPQPTALWHCYQTLTAANTRLRQPGINKSLLFAGVLQCCKRALS